MKNRFNQFFVAVLIAALIVGTGCNSENRAYKEAEKENTVSSFDGFLMKYPDGKNSINAKEKLRNLLITNLAPDWVVFIGEKKHNHTTCNNDESEQNQIDTLNFSGIWFGQSGQYTRDVDTGIIDWKEPNPKEQKIILVILKDGGLPNGLQMNKSYLWRGKKDFIFIKDIDGNLGLDELKKQFGLEHFSFGLNKTVSF